MAEKKLTIFDKLDRIFTREPLTKEELGGDAYMIMRFLSMNTAYTETMSRVQKYMGVLGYRIIILLQHLFERADKTPFLGYAKNESVNLKRFSDKSTKILKELFLVSAGRLEEYMPNLWVTEEEMKDIWGID